MFCFNDTATSEIYTLALHDALPISLSARRMGARALRRDGALRARRSAARRASGLGHARLQLRASRRSEEHTSELQSRQYLVCRLLLETKKNTSQLHPLLLSPYRFFP